MRLCYNQETKEKNIQIGFKLQARRELLGISRTQLAKKIGISHQQLYKYEAGINQVSLVLAVDIAKIFGISVVNLTPKPTRDPLTKEELESGEDVYDYATYAPKATSRLTAKLCKEVIEMQDDKVVMFLLDSLKGLKSLMENNQSKKGDNELIY